MPHDIRIISTKDFVRTDVTGSIDLPTSEQILNEIASTCAGKADYHVLLDNREAQTNLSFEEVFQLACSLKDIGLGVRNRIAVLAPPVVDIDRAGFFETVAQNRGLRVRAFRDFEKAFDWLTAT